jgi:hypothetical protein
VSILLQAQAVSKAYRQGDLETRVLSEVCLEIERGETTMTAIDTRQFMALMAIAQHHGRPGTPTDQAHVESFFSHLKGDWPHLLGITDPAALDAELARIRIEYNTIRLHASIGYVTPDDEHHGHGPQVRRARAAGMRRARAERIKQNRASKS